MAEANWTPGRVAKRCGVKVSTLHFYEEKGLIRSWRNAGNQRRYKADVVRRIAVIKAAQKVGTGRPAGRAHADCKGLGETLHPLAGGTGCENRLPGTPQRQPHRLYRLWLPVDEDLPDLQ